MRDTILGVHKQKAAKVLTDGTYFFFFTYQQGQTQKGSQIKGKNTTKLIFIHSAGKYDQDVKTLFLVLSTSSASLFTSCHLVLLCP